MYPSISFPAAPEFLTNSPSTQAALILLLPVIPLLLFQLTARAGADGLPVSESPFSLGEVYTTAAFVSVAGAVVLCFAVWPDMGGQVGGYVGYGLRVSRSGVGVGGAGEEDGGGGYSMVYKKKERVERAGRRGSEMWQSSGGNVQGQRELVGKGSRGGARMVQDGPAGRQEQVLRDRAQVGVMGQVIEEIVIPVPTTQGGRAQLRTRQIRETFPLLYSPYRPYIPSALIVCALIVAVLVVLSGHVLKAAYAIEGSASSTSSSNRARTSGGSSKDKKREKDDKDAAKMSTWVMAEIKHRQAEKDDPDKTLARVAKDAEKERMKLKGVQEKVGKKEFEEYRDSKAKERAKEIEVLRVQLDKLGLPAVGVPEKKEDPNTAAGAGEKGDGDAGGNGGGGEVSDLRRLKNTVSGWLGLDKPKEPKDKEEKPKLPVKEKIKQFLFLDAYDHHDGAEGGGGGAGGGTIDANKAKMEVEAYRAEVKAKTIADLEAKDAELEAARKINASAASAEALARKMKG